MTQPGTGARGPAQKLQFRKGSEEENSMAFLLLFTPLKIKVEGEKIIPTYIS